MTPEQFLQLARVLPEPTCLVTDEGRVLAANPPAAELLGLPAQTSQEVSLAELAHDDAEEIRAYLRSCSLSTEMLPGTLRLRAREGGELPCLCEGAAVAPRSPGEEPALVLLRLCAEDSDAGGVFVLKQKIEALGREMSERRRAEEELKATERRFLMFMENLPGLAWIKDREGRYIYANAAASEAFGRPRAELYGKTDAEIFPPETARQFRDNDLRALEGGACVQTLETLEQADGLHHSIVSKFPLLGPGGEAGLVGGVAVDITEYRRSEEALRESEEKYRSLLEGANDIIYSHDLEGNYLTINRAGAEVTGYTREEILGGLNIAQVVVPEHLELAKEMTRRKLSDPSPTVYEVDINTRDGRRLTLEVSTRIAFRGGRPVAVEGIARDVTERKRVERVREELLEREQKARRELEEASRLKDEFLATVSHELRTPLTAIFGWAHMLRSESLDAETRARAVEIIERNARSQKQLIDDILDVSRIITGKIRINTRPVELLPVIEAAREAVQPAAAAKEIIFQLDYDFREASVVGDSDRLQQVVWNLLSNAVKFTPAGGSIVLGLRRLGRHAEINVRDTGEGIRPEFLPRVFERFSQADGSITREHGGLGLGLAIVRHLVELHGGGVRAESEGKGRGASFTVTLPLLGLRNEEGEKRSEEAAGGDEKSAAPDAPPANLRGVRVLVVDDEEDALSLVSTALRMCGAEVSTAVSAAEALGALARERFDLLISDIGMPNVDGYELLRRASEMGVRLPAIALTAYARAEDRRRALDVGYREHLPKPIAPADLINTVARLAARSTQD
ncbi:MAG TPA: PAS domain S-box protein [Pyrinomonadaceae bacterium]|nr:PAS domain S-box protein [Pyrinomonadaceae bacterium]